MRVSVRQFEQAAPVETADGLTLATFNLRCGPIVVLGCRLNRRFRADGTSKGLSVIPPEGVIISPEVRKAIKAEAAALLAVTA